MHELFSFLINYIVDKIQINDLKMLLYLNNYNIDFDCMQYFSTNI